MLEHSPHVDRIFHALANPTRRAIVDRLSRGPTAAGDLARPMPVSLAAVVQHLQVLEQSGLVATHKEGRVRMCRLDGARLAEAEAWIARRRSLWEGRLDRLDALLGVPDGPTAAPRAARADTEPDPRTPPEEGTS